MADHPAPPPGLDPPHAFLQQAADYFAGQSLRFLSTFDVSELWALRGQLAKRRQNCVEQLRTTGACEFTDLRAGADSVAMRIDRSCLSFKRSGIQPGSVLLGVPPSIAKLLASLPLAEKSLTCPPVADPSPSDLFSQFSNKVPIRPLVLQHVDAPYLRPPKSRAQLV